MEAICLSVLTTSRWCLRHSRFSIEKTPIRRTFTTIIPQALDYIAEAPPIPQIESFEEGFRGLTRLHLSAGSFLQLICERITACSSAEVRFVGITAYALFTDPNFIKALSDQTSDARFLTLHVYLLKADSSSIKGFCQRSSETMDVLRQKLQMTRMALDALSNSEDHKKIRLVLYEYEALPTINLIQINNEFFFRPYKIGEKLPFLNVYNVKRNGQNEDVESWLDNVLNDLTLRSDIHTIKWNSSLGAPWPR